jgi:hypothetical protein
MAHGPNYSVRSRLNRARTSKLSDVTVFVFVLFSILISSLLALKKNDEWLRELQRSQKQELAKEANYSQCMNQPAVS